MISFRMVLVIIIAACGPFQFGYNTGVINAPKSTITQFLNETANEPYSSSEMTTAWSVIVSMFSAGGMLGSLSVGILANYLGRRFFMFGLSIFGVIAGVILGVSHFAGTFSMLVFGRFLVGVVSGAYTGVVPMYLSEVSPVAIRGSIGVVNQLSIVLAIQISQILGLPALLGNSDLWPLLLGLTAVPAAVQAVFVLFVCPESPRHLLITKSDEAGARRTLKALGHRTEDEVTAAIDEMTREAEEQRREKALSVIELFRRKELRWPLAIAIVMQLSQQLSGINGMFYYSTDLFVQAGLSHEDAGYATMGIGAVMVVMTVVSIPLIDRLGRKVLHCTGLGGMLVSAISITIFLAIRHDLQWASYVAVVFCLIFVVFFAVGPGSIPWMITAELFAQSSRPAAIAIATFVNWLANLVVALTFEQLVKAIDQYTFVIFSVLLLCFLLFTLLCVPETKGYTFQEIAAFFSSSSSPSKSSEDTSDRDDGTAFNPTLENEDIRSNSNNDNKQQQNNLNPTTLPLPLKSEVATTNGAIVAEEDSLVKSPPNNTNAPPNYLSVTHL